MRYKNLGLFTLFLLILIGYVLVIMHYPPANIVSFVGVENTYLIILIIALTVGVSAFTAGSFYIILITFFLGGANPFLLIFFSTIGLTLGDLLFYFLGIKGHSIILDSKYSSKVSKISYWIEHHSQGVVFSLIYLYMAISPFPKDILAVCLGIVSYPFKRTVLVFILGNFTFCLLLILFVSLLNFI